MASLWYAWITWAAQSSAHALFFFWVLLFLVGMGLILVVGLVS